MLPPVRTISSIELLRDGGSLAASFIGDNGSKYCLHFQLISKLGPAGEFVRLGYERPVIFERLEFRDGMQFEWRPVNEVEVSWEHAKVLLHQLRQHLRNDRDLKWLEAMEESANTEGGLPKTMKPVLQAAHNNASDA